MATVLLTGATGFVGSHLILVLQAAGWRVRAAVRSGAASLPTEVQACVVGDCADPSNLDLALAGVEVVVHLAARAHVLRETSADPLREFRRVNLDATVRLASGAAAAGVKRFVFLSSIGVNGKATAGDRPFTESDRARPHNAYAESKWEAEQALQMLEKRTGLEVVVIRPPLVYGPAVKANFLRLLQLVDRGFPLPLAGVENRRSLVGVSNLCDLIVRSIAHPAASGETFLVSDQHDLSTPALIRLIARAMGRPARLFPFPVAALRLAARVVGQGEAIDRLVGSLQVDSSKATRLLGWTPPVGVEEGLRRTVEWYTSRRG